MRFESWIYWTVDDYPWNLNITKFYCNGTQWLLRTCFTDRNCNTIILSESMVLSVSVWICLWVFVLELTKKLFFKFVEVWQELTKTFCLNLLRCGKRVSRGQERLLACMQTLIFFDHTMTLNHLKFVIGKRQH